MKSRNILIRAILCVFCIGLFIPTIVKSHEIRPALLEINEREQGVYDIVLKIPALGDRVLNLSPVFSADFKPVGPPAPRIFSGAYIEYLTITSEDKKSLHGETIFLDGLNALQIDVLVKLKFVDGTKYSMIIQPDSPIVEIPKEGSKSAVAGTYFKMGVAHILSGIDHLLFVLALLLIVGNYIKLLKTITSFTIAHSITLAFAAMGVVNIPPGPTEAVIALSIVFLCVEIVHSKLGHYSVMEQYPWIVAMIFGLFHGLGFAGALMEVGLPQNEIPLALLMFNIGVEVGQIMFVFGVILIREILIRLKIKWPQWSWRVLPYGIGSIAAFWVIQRVISFL